MLTSLKPKKIVVALDEVSVLNDYEKIQKALDNLALALPDGFIWPRQLRKDYNAATKAITRLKAQAKKDPARSF
jgi:hypothetical protein